MDYIKTIEENKKELSDIIDNEDYDGLKKMFYNVTHANCRYGIESNILLEIDSPFTYTCRKNYHIGMKYFINELKVDVNDKGDGNKYLTALTLTLYEGNLKAAKILVNEFNASVVISSEEKVENSKCNIIGYMIKEGRNMDKYIPFLLDINYPIKENYWFQLYHRTNDGELKKRLLEKGGDDCYIDYYKLNKLLDKCYFPSLYINKYKQEMIAACKN